MAISRYCFNSLLLVSYHSLARLLYDTKLVSKNYIKILQCNNLYLFLKICISTKQLKIILRQATTFQLLHNFPNLVILENKITCINSGGNKELQMGIEPMSSRGSVRAHPTLLSCISFPS